MANIGLEYGFEENVRMKRHIRGLEEHRGRHSQLAGMIFDTHVRYRTSLNHHRLIIRTFRGYLAIYRFTRYQVQTKLVHFDSVAVGMNGTTYRV